MGHHRYFDRYDHPHDVRVPHGPRHAFDEGSRQASRHGRHRAEEHHGRHGRPGRFFEHGDLRFVVLALVAERPSHGYELIKAIEERAGGAYSPSPGVIYPTLTLLEELGHVTVAAGDGGKKLHSITPEGERHLAANRAILDAAFGRMHAIAAANRDSEAPPLRRAFENLKTALRLRTGRGPLDVDQIRAIAAALDAAAVTIEQV